MSTPPLKIYVGGPMSGLPEFNYPAFFAAELSLMAKGFEVLNPARVEDENPTPGVPQDWSWYMRRTIKMLCNADGMALLPGWLNSRGTRVELRVAEAIRLDIRHIEDWLQ